MSRSKTPHTPTKKSKEQKITLIPVHASKPTTLQKPLKTKKATDDNIHQLFMLQDLVTTDSACSSDDEIIYATSP